MLMRDVLIICLWCCVNLRNNLFEISDYVGDLLWLLLRVVRFCLFVVCVVCMIS